MVLRASTPSSLLLLSPLVELLIYYGLSLWRRDDLMSSFGHNWILEVIVHCYRENRRSRYDRGSVDDGDEASEEDAARAEQFDQGRRSREKEYVGRKARFHITDLRSSHTMRDPRGRIIFLMRRANQEPQARQ